MDLQNELPRVNAQIGAKQTGESAVLSAERLTGEWLPWIHSLDEHSPDNFSGLEAGDARLGRAATGSPNTVALLWECAGRAPVLCSSYCGGWTAATALSAGGSRDEASLLLKALRSMCSCAQINLRSSA